MAAANTDKFMKAAKNWTGSIGAGGVSDAITTTIPLISSIGLPTDTAIEITIDRVDANGTATPTKMEVIKGVISGNNIINGVRGVEGTAQAHAAGAVVEIMLTADMWNNFIDAMVAEHGQSGIHKGPVVQSYNPAGGATSTLDLALGNRHKITMPAGNITIELSNETVGQVFMVEITQDSVGSRTVTWFDTIRWTDGIVPVLTTTANKKDTFGFIVDSAGNYIGYIMGQNI